MHERRECLWSRSGSQGESGTGKPARRQTFESDSESDWLLPIFGGCAGLRQWHHLAAWFFIIFTIIPVYLVSYHDYVEGHGVLFSMVGR